MSRPLRIEYPGAAYHITSQGSLGRNVFRTTRDRTVFLHVLGDVVGRFNWVLFGYLLMGDHYRLVLETPDANLSKGMRQLNGVYTQYFNRNHEREGALFDGRFRSVLFERELYLAPLCRELALEPIVAGVTRSRNSYRWSSHRAVAGFVEGPPFLNVDATLASFGKRRSENRRKYLRYVAAGMGEPSPLEERSQQILLGSDGFKEKIEPLLRGRNGGRLPPRRAVRRRSLRSLFRGVEGKSRNERNELIVKAHIDHEYTLAEIGDHLGIHYTTVSKVINS